MNPIDDQMNRLFAAAAHARAGTVAAPPFGLETRVLAAWREGRGAGMWDMTLLLRGLIMACVIMVVSLWPVLTATTNPYSEQVQMADSTIQLDPTP